MEQLTPHQNQLIIENERLWHFYTWHWRKRLPPRFELYEIEGVCLSALIRAASYYDPEKGKFSTILERITNSKMQNYIRDKNNPKRKGTVISIDTTVTQDEKLSLLDMQGKEDSYTFIESDYIHSAWRLMTELEQKCVYMKFYKDMNQRDIGKALGYSQNYVSKMIIRGLEKMKAYYEQVG